ncbi:hypothetical protein SCUP234_07192 [Seiridium cupressi]
MSTFLKLIVKNDAMKNDPHEVYNWRVYLLAGSACFGAMSFGWDSGVIGGVIEMPSFQSDYGLTGDKLAIANLKGNIVSVLQAGCFFGALAGFPIPDIIGRKWSLVFSSLLIMVGIIMQSAAMGHLEAMYIGRLISGFGVGCASVVNPIYVSENAPRAIRGLLTGLYQLFIVTGGMLAFWINYGAQLNQNGPSQYIVPLAVQGIPAVLLFCFMILSNESPRYLARKDKWEEARRVLQRVRQLPEGHPYLEDEIQEISDQLNYERQLVGDATLWVLLKEMFAIPTNRKRALLSIFLMVWQQMTGTNAINTYAPTIFSQLGVSGTSNQLFSTGIYGIVKVVACTAFLLFMADSLGRRRSLLVSSVGQSICMFYIGLYVRISPPAANAPITPQGYVALVCIFIFAAFFQFGWGPACWIYVAEIPTQRLRPLNVALAAATQWLFNFVVARAVPNMIATAGANGYGTYLIFGSFGVVMLVFVWFLVPETKGVSLEQMDALFGGVSREEMHAIAVDDEKRDAMAVEVSDVNRRV